MLIILEGLERCFKTSTVNYLRSVIKNPKLIVHHSSKPPKGLNKEQTKTWSAIHYTEVLETFSNLSAKGFDIIMDRAHIGEFVYGYIYRGNSETEDFMFHPEKYIDISDTYLVMLTDSPENVLSREDGESLSTSISDIQKEKERFIQGFKRSTILNKLHIDWAEFNSDVNFEQKKQLYYKQLSFFLSV